MKVFRYQAVEVNGAPVKGEIEAADRKSALQLLGAARAFSVRPRKLAPRPERRRRRPALTPAAARRQSRAPAAGCRARTSRPSPARWARCWGRPFPIPQALDGLGEEEENPALRAMVLQTRRFGAKRRRPFRRPGRAPEIVQQTLRQHGARGRGGRRAAQGHGRSGRIAGT